MTPRDRMLKRVRDALGRPEGAPPHGSARSQRALPALGKVMPPIPAGQLIGRFEEELKKVGGLSYRAGTPSELDEILRGILGPAGAGQVVLSRNPLLRPLQLRAKLEAWGHSVNLWPGAESATPAEMEVFGRACFSAAAGITGADFGLAESGSLVLTSETEGSQLASVAPPIHIALCRPSQVVESLEEVLDRLSLFPAKAAQARGRSIVLITGQSRTADIEQVTIRGVHGPLSLHTILVDDSLMGP